MSDDLPTCCPECGARLTGGECQRCLMAAVIEPTRHDDAPPGNAVPDIAEIAPHFPQLEILECLGRGGMGVVYKARQKSLSRLVALKLLAPEKAHDPQFAARFEKEARALAALNHPNIVAVHDFGNVVQSSDASGGLNHTLYYLLMEFVDGVNLRQLLQAKKLTPKEALSIVPPVCEALQCAHDHGIVHRDIKPENLLMDKSGVVKIADFGIAKIIGDTETTKATEVTQGTMALGTPAYAAPEQADGHADHRADIYSLGVVLYEMLTGERPKENLTPPSRRVQVDVRIDEIVLRALEKTPERRFATATEFRTQVEAVTADRPLSGAQRFFQRWLPERWFRAMQQESQGWYYVCECGLALSAWERGGIRFGAAGRPAKLLWCPACHRLRWHGTEWRGTETTRAGTPLDRGSTSLALGMNAAVWAGLALAGLWVLWVSMLLSRGMSEQQWLLLPGLLGAVAPLLLALHRGRWLRALAWSAFILAVPCLAITGLKLTGQLTEPRAWNPSPREALLSVLSVVGALGLPLLGAVLWHVSARSQPSHGRSRRRGWMMITGLFLLAAIMTGVVFSVFKEKRSRELWVTRQQLDKEQRSLADAVQRRLRSYHGRKPADNHAVLKVVYFHANDREPLPDYRERLERVLADVSDFYRRGLRDYGFTTEGIPFQRDAVTERIQLHVVRGQHPSHHYQHTSGDETWAEVRQALKDEIHPDQDHVLILYGLCEKARDGRYVFNAPYYGTAWSNQQHGLCHAADCELLDPQNFLRTRQSMVFTEHYYERQEMSVSQFNSWYIGGIAHELGHAFGLPHDSGSPEEQAFGVSLMGAGNLTYRVYYQDKQIQESSRLSLASAIRLATHPLFSRSDKGRWEAVKLEPITPKARAEGRQLVITGTAKANLPACAVIASLLPAGAASDHGALTFCSVVDERDQFELRLTPPGPGQWRLTLGALLANGAEPRVHTNLKVAADGTPDAAALMSYLQTGVVEQLLMTEPNAAAGFLTEERIAQAAPESQHALHLLRRMTEPAPPPVDLAATGESRVMLSDAVWTKAEAGYGEVRRNRFDGYPNELNGETGWLLRLGGQVYDKGISAHARSRIEVPLHGRWQRFTATVGLRDGAPPMGQGVFIVEGDGVELARSKILGPGGQDRFDLDVRQIKLLTLRTEGANGLNHGSWTVWCDPLLER